MDHASAVEQIGAVLAQGFLFYRPMPIDKLRRLLGFNASVRSGLRIG